MLRKYRCRNSECRHEFTLDIPVTSNLESKKYVKAVCPNCKSKRVDRLIELPALVFKGTGFYKTDNRSEGENQ
jgi:predicted nucleic acid-binding Zn ribbon protein